MKLTYRKPTGYKNVKTNIKPIATFIIPSNPSHPTIYINNRGMVFYSVTYASHKRIIRLFSDYNNYDMACNFQDNMTVYRLFKYRQLD